MIRPADLSSAAQWHRPSTAAPSRAELGDAASWFRDAARLSSSRIMGEVSASARGLSVEQHAAAVLAHLCGDADAGV